MNGFTPRGGRRGAPPGTRKDPATRGGTRGGIGRFREAMVLAFLAALTMAVFGQLATAPFTGLDDWQYIKDNISVRAGLTWNGVRWAFTTFHDSNWHPLTWLSHMLDISLFGMDPGPQHLVNLALHLASVCLVCHLLFLITGSLWRSALVAALFAIHPLHVESVAWLSERKDVLSTFFWAVNLGAYVRYCRKPSAGRYLTVPAAFIPALLSKPMVITMPFLLLLLDYWPLGRMNLSPRQGTSQETHSFRHLAAEKIPLMLLSAGVSLVTYRAQTEAMKALAMTDRVANALISYVAYAVKMLWPARLAFYYPHPGSHPAWKVAAAAVTLSVVSLAVILKVRKMPYLAVGWCWYLGMLIPVIGLVHVGGQAMADRYTYVPLIGLFMALTWAAGDLSERSAAARRVLGTLAPAILLSLAVAAWFQTRLWRDNLSLFGHTLEVTENNWLAHDTYGGYLVRLGRLTEAVTHFREALPEFQAALRINPGYVEARTNLDKARALLNP